MDVEKTSAGPVGTERLWCPSGMAEAPEAVVLGVRSGPDGSVTYLAEPVPAADLLPLIPEGMKPTRVLRFASHCESACLHRSGNDCTLIEKVRILPEATGTAVPRCHLRTSCKWWAQAGPDACRRCPAVSTAAGSDAGIEILLADPGATPEQVEEWMAADEAQGASGRG
ncbi:hypothetical protein ACFYPN_04440 [Streptomyces sp. NPDC005576]|uniref:hypothetical protein n=1 Tax=unclassified Streptomyces TaxID=2593676 RepID=UPI0033F94D16